MTSREARKERREQERRAAKLAYKLAKATGEPIGFVSHDADERLAANPAPPSNTNLPANPSRADINRANAQLSTGPRTIKGKLDEAAVLSEPKTKTRCSSRNSAKHGLASGQLIIPGEDPAAFEALLAGLLNDHQPANETEGLLVNEMAQSYWLEQRAITLQNQCFAENAVDEKRLALFLRYGATHNRNFYKALTTLTRLQNERRKLGNGFVSHAHSAAAHHGVHPTRIGFVSQPAPKNPVPTGFVPQNEPSSNLQIGFVSQSDPAEPPELGQTASKAA